MGAGGIRSCGEAGPLSRCQVPADRPQERRQRGHGVHERYRRQRSAARHSGNRLIVRARVCSRGRRCGRVPGAGDELAVDRGGVPVPVRQEHPDRPGDLEMLRTAGARAGRRAGSVGGFGEPAPDRPFRKSQAFGRKAHMAPCQTALLAHCQQPSYRRRAQRDQRLFPQHPGLNGWRSCRCGVHMVGPAVHRRLRLSPMPGIPSH